MRIIIINDVFDLKNRNVFEYNFESKKVKDVLEFFNKSEHIAIIDNKRVQHDYIISKDDQEMIIVNQISDNVFEWGTAIIGGGLILAGIFVPGMQWGLYVGAGLLGGVLLGQVAKAFMPNISLPAHSFSDSKTYSWEGIQNIYGEGNIVPIVYGKHYISGVVVEGFICGDNQNGLQENQYLNMLLALSEGEIYGIDINSIKINNLNISAIREDVNVMYGLGGNNKFDYLEISDVFTDVRRRYLLNALIDKDPYIYNLNDNANAILITIAFPSLFSIDDAGNIIERAVDVKIECALENEHTYYNAQIITCRASSKSRRDFQILYNLPDSRKYKIKISRITEPSTDIRTQDDCYLKSIEEIVKVDIKYKNTALLGLRIKASNKFNTSAPNIVVKIVGRKIKDVRTQSYNPETCNNPANILYDLLTSKRYGLGHFFTDDNIDLQSFIDFANFCDEIVYYRYYNYKTGSYENRSEKRFEMNLVIDQKYKAIDIINKILNTCRAMPVWSANKLKIVIDKPAHFTQMFNVSNIVADSFKQTYSNFLELPNQIDVDFLDEEEDYRRTTLSVVDKQRLDKHQSKHIDLFGLTTKSRVMRECYYQLRKLKAAKQIIQFEAEISAVVSEVGDVILVQHDTPAWGYGGRIKHVDDQLVYFDRIIQIEKDKSYKLLIRRKDNTILEHTFIATSSNLSEIYLNDIVEKDDLYILGEVNRVVKPFRITNISKFSSSNTVSITAVEYNESVYNEGTIDIIDKKYSHLRLDNVIFFEDNNIIIPDKIENPFDINVPYIEEIKVELLQKILTSKYHYASIRVYFDKPEIKYLNYDNIIHKYIILLSEDGENFVTAAETQDTTAIIHNLKFNTKYYIVVKVVTIFSTANYPELDDRIRKKNFFILKPTTDSFIDLETVLNTNILTKQHCHNEFKKNNHSLSDFEYYNLSIDIDRAIRVKNYVYSFDLNNNIFKFNLDTQRNAITNLLNPSNFCKLPTQAPVYPILTRNKIYFLGSNDIYYANLNEDGLITSFTYQTINILDNINNHFFTKNRVYLLCKNKLFYANINDEGIIDFDNLQNFGFLRLTSFVTEVFVVRNKVHIVGVAYHDENFYTAVDTYEIKLDGSITPYLYNEYDKAQPYYLTKEFCLNSESSLMFANNFYMFGGRYQKGLYTEFNYIIGGSFTCDGFINMINEYKRLPINLLRTNVIVTKRKLYLLGGVELKDGKMRQNFALSANIDGFEFDNPNSSYYLDNIYSTKIDYDYAKCIVYDYDYEKALNLLKRLTPEQLNLLLQITNCHLKKLKCLPDCNEFINTNITYKMLIREVTNVKKK